MRRDFPPRFLCLSVVNLIPAEQRKIHHRGAEAQRREGLAREARFFFSLCLCVSVVNLIPDEQRKIYRRGAENAENQYFRARCAQ